jgi:hypothetical protein
MQFFFIYLAAYLAGVVLLLIIIKPKHKCLFLDPVKRFDYDRGEYKYYLQCPCGMCQELKETDEIVHSIGPDNFRHLNHDRK